MDPSDKPAKPTQPFPRDFRGSLEVFNPSTTLSTNPTYRPPPTWQSWGEPRDILESEPEPIPQLVTKFNKPNELTSWMAIKEPTPSPQQSQTISAIITKQPDHHDPTANIPFPSETNVAAQRAAEWGLVLKTDVETGKPQGVTVRNSGGEDPNKPGTSRRNSGNSVRSSEGSDGEGVRERDFPKVSEGLKDALSTFQQTFVVSDATKPDFPILYASAGFFKMTGYTSKEVIGRNCRFLQGYGTNLEDVSKIREALESGKTYCGRLLNYKKDGTPFWNLLTISPIKDEAGKILKFIGMQVEVSKHTEGAKDKMVRPNGLPESLIRYDG